MLLKDCPVGSVVRLVSLCGNPFPETRHTAWNGCFDVMISEGCKYVIDGDGGKRWHIHHDPDYQFEIVRPAPAPNPEPRITFTVGGQEFYIGQRVWSAIDSHLASKGDALEVAGLSKANERKILAVRKVESASVFRPEITAISTTPPTPHEWKRGDWARHEEFGVGFVCSSVDFVGDVRVDFSGSSARVRPEDLTFISHTEIPE